MDGRDVQITEKIEAALAAEANQGGALVALKLFNEAQGEFCKMSPEQRADYAAKHEHYRSDERPNAAAVRADDKHLIGIKWKGWENTQLFLSNTDCDEK